MRKRGSEKGEWGWAIFSSQVNGKTRGRSNKGRYSLPLQPKVTTSVGLLNKLVLIGALRI